MQTKKKIIIGILSACGILFIIYGIELYYQYHFHGQQYVSACGTYAQDEVTLGTKTITADVADTECKRVLGLSGRAPLSDNQGMLFVFPASGQYGFWMKDMNFSLDIIWMSSNMTVVGIEKDLTPATYPSIFGEQYIAEYVLEVPAGFSDRYDVSVGNKISFSQKDL